MNQYTVIGLMSGTSLDGIDLAHCKFTEEAGKWSFQLLNTETISYQNEWIKTLTNAHLEHNQELDNIDKKYGSYLASKSLEFINKNKIKPDFIASHGHTIFHKPNEGITKQIGDGDEMARILKLPVIFDFRSLDVSLGGQGAPLVPIGDKLLFQDFDFCLNLGGFANISYDLNNVRLAQDICPVNMILNNLSQRIGLKFDESGQMAAKGNLNIELLQTLNKIPFYQAKAPKSLSREWFEYEFLPILKKFDFPTIDLLHTVTEHIAIQISKSLEIKPEGSVLVTGGGAHNTYLIKRIQSLTNIKLTVPDHRIVDFKEALIFAFLGVLRIRNEVNCLSSATGANKNNCGGRIAKP